MFLQALKEHFWILRYHNETALSVLFKGWATKEQVYNREFGKGNVF